MRKGNFNIDKKIQKLQTLKVTLPVILGNEAQNHFVTGFRKGGGQTDASAGGWKPRKKETKRTRGKRPLSLTGTLRRDIQRRATSWARTVVSTVNTDYAEIHNEGLTGKAFGKHPFKMPQREFIGESKVLTSKLRNIIDKKMQAL